MSPKLLEKPTDSISQYQKLQALAQNQKKDAIEQKALGVHIVENDENKRSYELFASEASGTSDAQWVLKKVKVQFFSENNSSFTVMGEVGEIDGTTKDMIIRGEVLTTSTNGYQFKTDSLRYTAKDKIMNSTDAVYMQGPPDSKGSGFQLRGNGLRVDIRNNKMEILSQVAASKSIDNKKFNLTSQTAEFYNSSQEALFMGQVRMVLGESKIEAPRARFFYSNLQKSLERIVVSQGVRLVEKDKIATCNELEMDLVEDKMTLRGNPKVQQGEDEIRGQEIVFLEGGKKVKINQVNVTGQRKPEK
ncbi:MAG: LPS export ABC transporter periplasmic protein LptC [Bdellovibrionales bacterium RIFCSPHIGHO2_01_FULL_40_29]|nr:MAG: LPS export ABC transporter periplasmic protein LptC [Bdellovibrionales bacterium RIFCSPHIGHO2_01_FULL_40_29]OFZ35466.1 MAG: LPS export ABC transporter periplasmic protein LptC [Bdellovibrionales bacterium RIFCSPHIGHO2_02_FULL_40_15]